jgi:molybdate transport system substrate-binding protein
MKELVGQQPFDVVIVGAPEIEAFMLDGKVKLSSRADVAKSGVGIAVKAGAAKPDIGTSEAVKRALLAAKSVAYSTGPSGVYVQKLFEKLGIAAEMKPKSVQTVSPRRVGQYLAAGEAELGFQQVSELMHEQGIDYLGPLPADIQNFTLWSSGILATSGHVDRARTFQAFLAGPKAIPAIRKNGMEPVR